MKEENPEITFEHKGCLYRYKLTEKLDAAAREIADEINYWITKRRSDFEYNMQYDPDILAESVLQSGRLRSAVYEEMENGFNTPDTLLLIAQHAVARHIDDARDVRYKSQLLYTLISAIFLPNIAHSDEMHKPMSGIQFDYITGDKNDKMPDIWIDPKAFSFASSGLVRQAADALVNFICDVKGVQAYLQIWVLQR